MAASDTIALHCQAQDDGWLVTVAGDNTTTTTSRRLDRVLAAARPLLERYCEPGGQVDDLDVSIEVVAPPPVAAAVRSALDASHHAANHQDAASAATREAVRILIDDQGIGLRDAGALLGLSYERVRQLHSSEAAGVAPRPGRDGRPDREQRRVVISAVDLARVRAAADLVAIAGEHTQLKRVGRQWMATCPFHEEPTPSLSINAEEGLWWCFGCQQGGDAITFVQRIHHLEFVDAVEWLAARAGITLAPQSGEANPGAKTRLVAITRQAAEWYHGQLLNNAEAQPARDYLAGRGVTRELLEDYQVGWAPAGWDELVRTLNVPAEVAIAAGVAKTNRAGRLQDMFRSRITFPIHDVAGDVIGFGARRLADGEGPKYLNSPDSALYEKSRALYGLHRAKSHIVTAGASVVCEGYLDVIGAAAADISTAVASCGTALGSDHLQLLGRFADRIILAFDADTAGAKAAARLHHLEAQQKLTLAVATLPSGTDPGDLGFTAPDQLRQCIDDAKPLMTFLVDRAIDAGDRDSIEGPGTHRQPRTCCGR